MKKITNILFVFLLTIGASQVSRASVELGDTAIDFTLESYAGDTVHLADYRGKVVMLLFVGFS
jgi:hypothetical protein